MEFKRATVRQAKWGWIVRQFDGLRSPPIAYGDGARMFAAALNAGECWSWAWNRLKMNQWVRVQDGGTHR
jgi:hypothetical protein